MSELLAPTSFDGIIVIDYYLPGVMGGGPVTTIRNLMTNPELSNSTRRFLIVTKNMDVDGTHYSVPVAQPILTSAGWVLYLPKLTARTLLNVGERFRTRCFYLNGFFSPTTIRMLLAVRMASNSAALALAPRGEFSAGALRVRRWKKRPYILLFKALRLGRNVKFFHASTSMELGEITRTLGPVPGIVAEDPLPAVGSSADVVTDELPPSRTVVFLSRIVPKKNLLGALRVIALIEEPVRLQIYGPEEDAGYAAECRSWCRDHMPEQHKVEFMGPISAAEVMSIFAQNRVFLFPTFGENFGHVIPEALSAGCPVVLSDTTPWQDLDEQRVGVVRPCDDFGGMAQALSGLLDEDDAAHSLRRTRCREYARTVAEDGDIIRRNQALLDRIAGM